MITRVRPSVLRGNACNAGHYEKAFHPGSLIPTVRTWTIDLYRFKPFLVAWTIPASHEVTGKQTLQD